MSDHSLYSPSSFYRWQKCPGSLGLIKNNPDIKDTPSSYAEEGTRLHTLAYQVLMNESAKANKEDLEIIAPYVNYVQSLSGKMHFEVKVRLKKIHPMMFGHADAIVYQPEKDTLEVIDFKAGAGIPVEAVGNAQLRIYAIGALETFPDYVPAYIKTTIVQPRCYHAEGPIRSEVISAAELLEFWHEVKSAVIETQDPDAPLLAGDHCRFCPVKIICPAIKEDRKKAAVLAFDEIKATPVKLDEAMAIIPQLELWIEAVKEYALMQAKAHKPPKGYKLVEKRSQRKWRDEAEAAAKLEEEFGVSVIEMFEKKFKSPAQMEKLINREDRKRFVSLIKTESTGLTLAPVTDSRPAVVITEAKEVFSTIETEENE